jgi:hypothetical protein
MPCYDAQPGAQASEREQLLIKRNEELINLLCRAGRAFAAGEVVPDDVIAFWQSHADQDELRGDPWVIKQQMNEHQQDNS